MRNQYLKYLSLVFFIFSFAFAFSQEELNEDWKIEVELPADFLSHVFRPATDKYLVAWHGSVKLKSITSTGGDKNIAGGIDWLAPELNKGLNKVFSAYFNYNMKDGQAELIGPDNTVWAARCGLKSQNNINISPLTGEDLGGFPGTIESDVEGFNYTLKSFANNTKTGEKRILQIYLQTNSIYYYDKTPGDLDGSLTRADGYKLCGNVVFERLGPKSTDQLKEETAVEDEAFEFKEQLVRGDYKVSYQWLCGDLTELCPDFVYNPTARHKEDAHWEIEKSNIKVKGRVVFKSDGVNEKQGVKACTVKLKPVCEESGLPELQTTSDENGFYEFEDVPLGEYRVVVSGAQDVDAKHTNPDRNELKVEDSELSVLYDVTLTFNAPGFYEAQVVWPNTNIRFPKQGEPIPKLMITDMGEDFNGQGLTPPMTIFYRNRNTGTYFNFNEDEFDKPVLKYARPTGGNLYRKIVLNHDEDAPHMFTISRNAIGEPPGIICIRMQVDFICYHTGVDNLGAQNILSIEPETIASSSKDGFEWGVLDEEIIKKIQKGEPARKELTNSLGGKATIEFKPVINE